MINKNLKGTFLVFSVITMFIFCSIGSQGGNTINNDDRTDTKQAVICISAPAQIVFLENQEPCFIGGSFDNLENIVVTNTTENESYPSMITSGYRALVAYECEHEGKTHVYFRNSKNYGQSWSSSYASFAFNLNTFSPSLCIKPYSKTAYCAVISDYNDSGLLYDVEFTNIDDLGTLDAAAVDWSTYGFFDFSRPDIVYYSDSSHPDVPFVTVVIGSTTYEGGACTNTPMFFYRTPNKPNYYTISWDPGLENCSNVSTKFDVSSKKIYGVCEIKNETKKDILLFYDNPLQLGDYLDNQTLSGSENLTHPQIFLSGNQIYIVAETDTNGVVLYNSSNKGNTWNLNNVTKDILPIYASPKNPLIYTNETQLSCVFTESGNISITTSVDNGVTWDAPIQLNSQNGSVVEGYRYSNFPDLDHVVWTDNREGNNDIYSVLRTFPGVDLMVIPESVNIIKGEFKLIMPTKNWINFTVKNKGNWYVEEVFVKVTYTCLGNITRSTKYPGYVLFLDGFGAEMSFRRPLFRITLIEFLQALRSFAGVQNITVTVDLNGMYNDVYPEDNSVTIPVKYADIFPNLSFLEKYLSPKG